MRTRDYDIHPFCFFRACITRPHLIAERWRGATFTSNDRPDPEPDRHIFPRRAPTRSRSRAWAASKLARTYQRLTNGTISPVTRQVDPLSLQRPERFREGRASHSIGGLGSDTGHTPFVAIFLSFCLRRIWQRFETGVDGLRRSNTWKTGYLPCHHCYVLRSH